MTPKNPDLLATIQPTEPTAPVAVTGQSDKLRFIGDTTAPTPTTLLPEHIAPSGIVEGPVAAPAQPVPTIEVKKGRGKKTGATIAIAAVALAGAANVFVHFNKQDDADTRPITVDNPPVTAAPSPTFQETTLPPKTIVVPAKPVAPATTAATQPKQTQETSAPPASTSKPAEAEKSKALTDKERKTIEDATDLQLEGHKLQVIARLEDNMTVASIDDSELPVPLSQLTTSLELTKQIAAQEPTFTVSEQGEEVKSQASPSNAPASFWLVTKDAGSLSDKVALFPKAYTFNSSEAHVTVVEDQPGETVDGFDANSFNTDVEAIQTKIKFTGGDREREPIANGLAYAIESARSAIPYEQYAVQAAAITFRGNYYGDHYIVVSQERYNNLAAKLN